MKTELESRSGQESKQGRTAIMRRQLKSYCHGMILAQIVTCGLLIPFARAGELEQFFYLPLPGESVSDLTSAPEFPEQPFTVTPVNWFNRGLEGITNASTYYGSWLRGYLEAPVTGDFTFYVSADDSAELYLSTDHQAAHKQLIARLQSSAPNGVYDQQFDQRSVPLRLERGRQYYFEIQHKQDGGTDHVQVGWLRPDNVLERPIPLRYVQRFVPASYDGPGVNAPASIAPVVEMPFTVGPIVKARENQHVILAPNVSAVPPVYYQWFKNGVPLAGEHLSSLDLGEVTEADHGELFTLLVASAHGLELSADWPLQVWNDAVAPTIASAFVSGMTDGFLLTFSEPLDLATATNPANYTLNLGINVTSVSLLYGTNLTTVVVRTTSFPPAGIPEVTVNHVRDRAQPPNTIAPNSTKLVSLADGRITLRYFGAVGGGEPLGGTALTDLPNPGQGNRFPNYPDLVTTRNEMGIPQNIADNYAAQLIGFLVPRVTGDYQFLISSDDQGILYLSTDANPANKRAIAIDPQWGGYRDYLSNERRTLANTGNSAFISNNFPGLGPNVVVNDSLNTVGLIHLEAGHRYYIEAVMKEGGGGDNLDVTWVPPGGRPVVNGQSPIPGEFLAQWPGPNVGQVAITNQPVSFTVTEGRRASFSVGVTGSVPYTYQWFRNGVPVVDADGPTHTFPTRLIDNDDRYSVRVRNDFSEVWSNAATLYVSRDTQRPRIARAYADQHFDKVTLRFDEPVTAATASNLASYAIARTDNGQPLAVHSVALGGQFDGGYTNVVLRTGPIESGVNYTVRTSGIRDLADAPNLSRPEDAAAFTGWVLSRGFALYERWEDSLLRGCAGCFIPDDVIVKDPIETRYLTAFDSPEHYGSDSVSRISGFFVAPTAGRHDFYMASDGNGALWIANDSTTALAQYRIAVEPAWGSRRSWTGSSDGSRSPGDNNTLGDVLPILEMTTGEHRYLEMIWTRLAGGGYGAATYSGPGEPVPVNGSYSRLTGNVIAGWTNPDAVTIAITDEPDDLTRSEGNTATFSVSASAVDWDGLYRTVLYQWQLDGVDIPGANSWSYTTPALLYRREPSRYRCFVSSLGVETLTREAQLRTACDDCDTVFLQSLRADHTLRKVTLTVTRAIGLATATNLENYRIDGLDILSIEPSNLSPDWTRTVTLHTSPQQPGKAYILNVTGLVGVGYPFPEINDWALPFSAFSLQPGWILREVWMNIFGRKVADLTNHVKFPDHSDQVNYLPSVEAPANVAEAHEQRLSGWLQVTNTGSFNFAIAANDQAVFYLSTDESPANKRAIVTEPEWGAERDWNSRDRRLASPGDDFFPAIDALPVNHSENTTGPIHLIVGERYYFEVLNKGGNGFGHAEVTIYQAGSPPPANGTPGISGALVWNYLPSDVQISIFGQPQDLAVCVNSPASFSVSAHSTLPPIQYQWERNGAAIPGATLSFLQLPAVDGWDNGAIFRCRITSPPAIVVSAPARLRVIGYRNLRAAPLGTGGVHLVWGDDGTPVQLQSTTNLFPTPNWMNRNWSGYRNGLNELFVDPPAGGAPTQEFFRVLLAE